MLGGKMSRDVPCVVFRILLGFIGVLMLLVDDYHTEIFKRSEYRRSRTYNKVDLAALNTSVGI